MDEILENSESFEPPKPSPDFRYLVSNLSSNMNFVGIFVIVYGALTCLSIIGAIIGVPLIMSGLRLREAANYFSSFKNSYNFEVLRLGFEYQNKFFNIIKILIIVGIVLTVLYIIFFLIFFASFFSAFSGGDMYMN